MGPLRLLILFVFIISSNLVFAYQNEAGRLEDETAASTTSSSTTSKSQGVPHTVRYGGVLHGADGSLRTGVAAVTFALYREQQGGAPLWVETQNVTLDEQGRYTVLLGSTSSGLPTSLFTAGEARWLGVRVAEEGGVEQPRVALVSVPYALAAADAQSLGGRPVTDFQLTRAAATVAGDAAAAGVETSGAVSSAGNTAGKIAKFTATDILGDSVITENAGNIGVNIATPAATLSLGPAVGEKFDFYQSGDGSIRLGIGIDQVNGPRELNLFTTSPTLNGSGRITLGYRREDSGQFVGNVTILNSGNMGLGTSNPAATLSLGPAIGEKFDFYQSPDSSVRLGIGIDQVNAGRELNLFTSSPTLNGSGRITLGYRREDNGQFVGNVTILNSGNMGVGTSNPAATLSLGQAVGEKFDFYQSPDSNIRLGIGIDQVNGPRELNLFTTSPTLSGSGRITLGYRREDNGQFVGNMAILNGGNVGIGSVFPSQKLEVAGTIYSTSGGFKFPDATVQTTATTTTNFQARITGTCVTGQYVRIVNQDGTVTCGVDQSGAGGITYPFDSGNQSTTSGAFKVTQTNSVALPQPNGPDFAFATTSIPAAIVGSAANIGSNTAVGVVGISNNVNSPALVGWNGATGQVGTNTEAQGVIGQSDAIGGTGVEGNSNATTGSGRGGNFQSNSPNGVGIHASNSAQAQGGLAGQFDGGVTVNGTLKAQTFANTGGQVILSGGAQVQGNLSVTGSLSKTSGTFKIDHPLDPANKYLYHSFVESPDMMNIYNGLVILDAKGEAWITMPDWFEALNMDFRYQLTAIGRPLPKLYVASEMKGNRFKISGGKSNAKVSWQVTGIRHDPYADAHRIQVEVEKPLKEQGTYIFPEFYQKPVVAKK